MHFRVPLSSLGRFRRRWFILGNVLQFLALLLLIISPLPAEYRPGGNNEPVWYNASGQPDPENAPPEGPDTADSDGDGLQNWHEQYLGTNPYNPDGDNDMITDFDEQNVTFTNPNHPDSDGDGIGDLQDWLLAVHPHGDYDGDGLSNTHEAANNGTGYAVQSGEVVSFNYPLNMLAVDSNGDGVWTDGEDWNSLSLPSVDADADGLTNGEELLFGTHPKVADTDGEGLSDAFEIQTSLTNPLLPDTDGNGVSDYDQYHGNTGGGGGGDTDADGDTLQASLEATLGTDPDDADSDDDGLLDGPEYHSYSTNPLDSDTDDDGLLDGFEVQTSSTDPLNSDSDANGRSDYEDWTLPLDGDQDQDGLSNGYELQTSLTDPADADSDDDELPDGQEVNIIHTNPLSSDSDSDGLADVVEYAQLGTDPLLADTDGDTVDDGQEVAQQRNPLVPEDADQDGLPDHLESYHGTDPNDGDSDDDNLSDGAEISGTYAAPTNPLMSDTDGDTLSDGFEVTTSNYANGLGSDPATADGDGDGLDDAQELAAGTDSWSADTDGDALSDYEELYVYANVSPLNAHSLNANYTDWQMVDTTDSDGGGIPDRIEQFYGMDVLVAYDDVSGDLDNDGVSNVQAWSYGWDLSANYTVAYDNDEDWASNVWEIAHGFNPNSRSDGVGDPDGDGLFNFEEASLGTNPLNADTDNNGTDDWAQKVQTEYPQDVDKGDASSDWDGDGWYNYTEVYEAGTNPRDASSYPTGEGGAIILPESMTLNWLAAWYGQSNPQRGVPPFFSLPLPDGDGDGLPDILEQFFGMDMGSGHDAAETAAGMNYTNLQRYQAGQNLNNGGDALQEWMEDFIPNVWKVYYAFDLLSTTLWNEDPDGDGISNLMEYLDGKNPLVADLLDPETEAELAALQSARFEGYLLTLGMAGVGDRNSGAVQAATAAAAPVIAAQQAAEAARRAAALAQWGEVQIVSRAAYTAFEQWTTGGGGGSLTNEAESPVENVDEPEMEDVNVAGESGGYANAAAAAAAYQAAAENQVSYPVTADTGVVQDPNTGTWNFEFTVRKPKATEGGSGSGGGGGGPGTGYYRYVKRHWDDASVRSAYDMANIDEMVQDQGARQIGAPDLAAAAPVPPPTLSEAQWQALSARHGTRFQVAGFWHKEKFPVTANGTTTSVDVHFAAGAASEIRLRRTDTSPEAMKVPLTRTFLRVEREYQRDETISSDLNQFVPVPNQAPGLSLITLTIPPNQELSVEGTGIGVTAGCLFVEAKADADLNRMKEVKLLPMELQSRDRAVTGTIPHLGKLLTPSQTFEIGFEAGGMLLGKYEIPQTGAPAGVKIYDNADSEEAGMFGNQELDLQGALPPELTSQAVVLARESNDQIRFGTISDTLGAFKIHLYLGGTLVGTLQHELKRDDEFAQLIAAVEKFVAGDSPPRVGEMPTPIFAAPPVPPELTDEQVDALLALLPQPQAASYPGLVSDNESDPQYAAVDAESFRGWIRITKVELSEEAWADFSASLANVGYDIGAATDPIVTGWNAGRPPEEEIQLPGSIRNRGIVAKILLDLINSSAAKAIGTVKGVVYGLWDGLKSDWDGVEGAFKMPAQLYQALTEPYKTAAELYSTISFIKKLTRDDLRLLGTRMFDEFIENQQARLGWPSPAGADEALLSYIDGYLLGYIAEQIAIVFITLGLATAVRMGKYIVTIFQKVQQGIKILAAMALIEGRLPKIFVQAMEVVAESEVVVRRLRAVSARVKSVPMQARFLRSCVDELSVPDSTARSRLRSSLGGVSGDGKQAHHLIPWEHRDHPLVQRAARGGFNINNGGHNGILLDEAIHQGVPSHPGYNGGVRRLLDALEIEASGLTEPETANLLIRNAGMLRMAIESTGHALSLNSSKASMDYMVHNMSRNTNDSVGYALGVFVEIRSITNLTA